MSSPEPGLSPPPPESLSGRTRALKRLTIWALFLLLVYVTRDFFFLAFMTFMFSYTALAIVAAIMRRVAPNQDRPGLRRLLTFAVFVFTPLLILGIGALIAPTLISQGQRLAGWLSHMSPEAEIARQIEQYVGPSEFRRMYGGPEDPRYQSALADFRKTGERHVAAYLDFPALEAWIDGGFNRQFAEAETARARSHLLRDGTSGQEFELWFRTVKFPDLQASATAETTDKGRSSKPADPLVRMAAALRPDDMLKQVRRDPALLARLRDEWLKDSIEKSVATAQSSPACRDKFRAYYEEQRRHAPDSIPYTFDEFVELARVRPQGAKAFGEALTRMQPSAPAETDTQIAADFEAAKKHDLFQEWWSTNATAKFVQNEMNSRLSGNSSGFVERVLTALLNVPIDLMTALLLSFFICIDFPRLQRAAGRLRETGLHDVHAEMAPALTSLAHLIGRSIQAQGIIAACNAAIMFLLLTFLGVEHATLLACAIFVLCLVPSLGMIISWILLVAVAFAQPGGGLGLAVKVTLAVLFVEMLELFVFSPRILGKLMELHPVVTIAILPVAHYFFGVWGLILAVPVTVYLIQDVIMGGRTEAAGESPPARTHS